MYNLLETKINGYICVKVDKVMYGIYQTGIMSHTYLKKHLHPLNYASETTTSVLRSHNKNVTTFTLVVGDFGINTREKRIP